MQKEYVKCLKVSDPTRTTLHKIYELNGNYITDDRGNKMQPSIANQRYWVFVDCPEEIKPTTNTMDQIMLDIKQETLINGKPASEMTMGHLMNLLIQEQKVLDDLKAVEKNVKSKTVSKSVCACGDNIMKLVEILDAREAIEDAKKAKLCVN